MLELKNELAERVATLEEENFARKDEVQVLKRRVALLEDTKDNYAFMREMRRRMFAAYKRDVLKRALSDNDTTAIT